VKNKKRKSPYAVIFALAVCLAVCILGLNAQAQHSSSDEESVVADVYTDEILEKAEITLNKDDTVIRTEGDGYVVLNIVRAFDVKINFSGTEFTVRCSEDTVADAIAKAGITLTKEHRVTPELSQKVTPDTNIYIVSDSGVTLTADGETRNCITTANTVEEFLLQMNIILGEDDIVSPELSESIYEGMSVVVQRVEYKEEIATEVVDYGFITEETDDLVSGTSKIKQYGIEGERTLVTKSKYIDGELSESVVVSDEVTKEPVDQIKLIGTGRAPSYQSKPSKPSYSGGASVDNAEGSFVDASGNTVYYKRKLTGSSTAYYAAEGAITATGVPVYVGGVAVNPNVIPYGSKLYIVSSDGKMIYGYATAVDTGGALMSGSVLVDVFYSTYGECMNWGRRNVTVYVLS